MLVIGLTGSFGTGKTTVAGILRRLGAKILDADRLNRDLLKHHGACFRPVVRYFGQEILTSGNIDRRKLSTIVFNHPAKLKRLCTIIHPAVIREIEKKLTHYRRSRKQCIAVIDAPLLIEAGLDRVVDFLVVVNASQHQQIERVVKSKGLNRRGALKRIKAQMPLKAKIRMADVVINNRGSLAKTKKQVEALWRRLRQREQ